MFILMPSNSNQVLNEYSYIHSARKDYLDDRTSAETIIANHHELYAAFKQKTRDAYKMQFQKFCKLHLPRCITAGDRGAPHYIHVPIKPT